MEGIARIGRYTIDLTEQMGRMMLFVLSSFAWLTRPPFRV
ncbi:MAG: ABC transporter permease, partial [Nitrospira sp.]|nr:ABC transporter permease [Nitrospira sp.]